MGTNRHGKVGHAGGQAIVAINTSQLFQQVCLDSNIKTPARYRQLPALLIAFENLQAQPRQDVFYLGRFELQMKASKDAGATQVDLTCARVLLGGDINDRAGFAANYLQQQPSSPLNSLALQLGVYASLKAMR